MQCSPITDYHAKYFAFELTRQRRGGDVGRLSSSLFDASVDFNPHQIDAALFALQNPLVKGVVLADEVGLGKIRTSPPQAPRVIAAGVPPTRGMDGEY